MNRDNMVFQVTYSDIKSEITIPFNENLSKDEKVKYFQTVENFISEIKNVYMFKKDSILAEVEKYINKLIGIDYKIHVFESYDKKDHVKIEINKDGKNIVTLDCEIFIRRSPLSENSHILSEFSSKICLRTSRSEISYFESSFENISNSMKILEILCSTDLMIQI